MALPVRVRRAIGRARRRVATVLAGTREEAPGVFVPYEQVAGMTRPGPYPAVRAVFERAAPATEAFIAGMGAHREAFASFDARNGDPDWHHYLYFPPLDGAAAYTAVRRFRPRRILEIGSGNSTRYLARAVRDGGGDVGATITCIDPAPRRAIAGLGVGFERRTLAEADAARMRDFEPGDILFVDSSHVMLEGSDVDIEFNRMFPELAPGVIVHVHDVFLPEPYPAAWEARRYSEQNALVGWIVSGFFDVVYPGHHATLAHAASIDRHLGQALPFANRAAGSLWLRKA